MMYVNERYSELFFTDKRYVILMGGRGAGRSTVASQYALAKLRAPEYFRCAIMRFVLSDIKNSIYQDILDRIEEQDLRDEVGASWMSFTHGANLIKGIGFRKSSGDQKAKLKSLANYNCVIVEEADEVSEDDFMQLDDSIRTAKSDIKIILLLNPPSKRHWIIRRWFNLEASDAEGFYVPKLKESASDTTMFIHSTYHDNEVNIADASKSIYEGYRETRPDHYYGMIRGLVSDGVRGRVFKNWKAIPYREFAELPYPSLYGLDFGFSNHPTAMVEVKMHNQSVWAHELTYQTGLTNQAISKEMDRIGVKKHSRVYADSAEPKSIEELKLLGWNVIPAIKGPDSVNVGIDMLLGMEVRYTEESQAIRDEEQGYRWALDRNKEPTNEPVDEMNHCMDAIRYAVFTERKTPVPGVTFI